MPEIEPKEEESFWNWAATGRMLARCLIRIIIIWVTLDSFKQSLPIDRRINLTIGIYAAFLWFESQIKSGTERIEKLIAAKGKVTN